LLYGNVPVAAPRRRPILILTLAAWLLATLAAAPSAQARLIGIDQLVATADVHAGRGLQFVPGRRGRAIAVTPGAPALVVRLPEHRRAVTRTRVRARISRCAQDRLALWTGRRTAQVTGGWTLRDVPIAGDRIRIRVPAAEVPARCRVVIDAVEVVESVPLGAAVWSPFLDEEPRYAATLDRSFQAITPENELKMALVHPERDRYDFAGADRLVDLAARTGKSVHGHVLIWGEHLPGWVTEHDLFGRSVWTPDALREALKAHVQTLVWRYRGRIKTWDVVNEAVAHDGSLKRNFLLDMLGPSYIDDAFRWAHEADPDARLFLNEKDADVVNPRSTALLKLASALRDKGLRVDGVGLQHHLSLMIPPTMYGLYENAKRFSDAGFAVRLSELDVAREGRPADEALRGDVYRRAADACMLTPRCEAITLWGVGDRYSWLGPDEGALPFDTEFAPKPWWAPFADRVAGRTEPS